MARQRDTEQSRSTPDWSAFVSPPIPRIPRLFVYGDEVGARLFPGYRHAGVTGSQHTQCRDFHHPGQQDHGYLYHPGSEQQGGDRSGHPSPRSRSRLLEGLQSDSIYEGHYNTRKPRQLKVFDHPTEVQFEQDYVNSRTVMEISALDMPGLLSVIANVIAQLEEHQHHARQDFHAGRENQRYFLPDRR